MLNRPVVSKKDFLAAGCDPKKITSYSGHTYTRLYLEEDCDASYFIQTAKENGFEISIKNSYNPAFNIKHNYKPELFDFQPIIGTNVFLSDKQRYNIVEKKENGDLIVENKFHANMHGLKYRIGKHNPFQYIQGRA